MILTIVICNACGTTMVVSIKDIWKLKRCTKCESSNIETLENIPDTEEIQENYI